MYVCVLRVRDRVAARVARGTLEAGPAARHDCLLLLSPIHNINTYNMTNNISNESIYTINNITTNIT